MFGYRSHIKIEDNELEFIIFLIGFVFWEVELAKTNLELYF